jgi:hypothetical protein
MFVNACSCPFDHSSKSIVLQLTKERLVLGLFEAYSENIRQGFGVMNSEAIAIWYA